MTENAHVTLQGLLGMLEGLQNSPDDADYSKKCHNNLLMSLNTLLGRVDAVASTDADKVLRLCLRYKNNLRSVPYVLSIVSTLINIDKTKEDVDFLPSALAILDFLRTKCIEDQANHLRTLSFQVLMAHPKATLIKLVANHSPILIETFGLYLAQARSVEVKMEAFILLQLLEWLPECEKVVFIKEGIPLWLSKVLPTLVEILTMIDDNEKIEINIQYVELLTNKLVLFDYFDYPEWRTLVNNIVDPKMFPASIKSWLEKDKYYWHRMWIIIVKLLKSLVTRNISPFGSPINSMLPVVETAFKRESPHRVRAFKCWDELILNFSNETNAHCVAKRIKLVIIPLKLNNTRTEEAVVAKFNTWWLLIRKFKLRIEQFANEILILFLQFVFGRDHPKPSFWAGQLSQGARVQCLEALVEIVGHNDCVTKCTKNIAPLNGKIINTVLLIDHWNHWIHSLRGAIKLTAMNYTVHTKKNIMCIWKSYLLLMAELLDNSVRRDLFDELVNLLGALLQDFKLYVDLPEIMITDLVLPLFSDNRLRTLLSSKGFEHRPMHKIVKIIVDKSLDPFYNRFLPQDLMSILNPIVAALMSDSTTTPAYLIWILDHLPSTESALKLWTALVKTATESDLCQQVLNSILRWPLKVVHSYTEVKEAASAWYALYNVMHVKLDMSGFDNEISKVLTKPVDDSKAANYFYMFALIGVLKHKPDEDKMAKLEALTDEMTDYKELEQIMPPLVDTLVLMLDYVAKKEDDNLAEIVINCVKNVLRVNRSEKEASVHTHLEKAKEIALSDGKVNIHMINKTLLSDTIIAAMKIYLAKCTNESIKSEIRKVISSHDNQVIESPKKTEVVPKEFASPKVEYIKKKKKKEASIVNTVVENGEEYVVVESNWNFNPKNFTENQKEKFQRKREIPALYQDLSQSQDEFRLTSWKTDSQDISLSSSKSNSKSASNTNAKEVLLNMPSADVVPTILEGIVMDGKNKSPETNAHESPVSKDKPQKVDKMTPSVTKSPRMALKDRVFRNVRNLIEKSSPSPQKETIVVKEATNHIENVSASPVHKPKNDDLVNVAEKQTQPEQQTKPEDSNLNDKQDNPTPNVSNSCLVTDKQENLTPNISQSPEVNTKRVIIVTAKQNNQNITIVCKPVSDPRKATTPLLSAERPARMKRKPKKYDDSLLLDLKRSRNLNDSQKMQDSEPEITVAQVHSSKENNVDTVQRHVAEAETLHMQKNDKGQTIIDDDVMMIEYDIRISDNDCIGSHETIKTVPVTPTTPSSENPTEKSPEKPTNVGEIPTNISKASEGIENDGGQIVTKDVIEQLPIVTTPLKTKIKEVDQQKSTIKKVSAQNDENSDTINMPPSKCKRSKVQNENVINDDKTPSVSTPVNKIKDTGVHKSSVKKGDKDKHSKSNKGDEKWEEVITPVNKGNKAKVNIQSKSTKKRAVQKETEKIDENSDTLTKPLTEIEDVSQQNSSDKDKDVHIDNKNSEKDIVTPKKAKDDAHKSSMKKTNKKSRIEKELMIDMVEGHPFLQAQSEKRLTRKQIIEAENSGRRKSLAEKLNKSKLEATPKPAKKSKDKKISSIINTITVEDSQDRRSSSPEDAVIEEPCSEDIIESSQDSTITTVSVKSTKRPTMLPVVALRKINIGTMETQDLIQDGKVTDVSYNDRHEKTDIELPQNKTVEEDKKEDKNTTDLTENMDTEPMGDHIISDNIIVLSESVTLPIEINSVPQIGPETQELAEAKTQPNDPNDFVEFEVQPHINRQNDTEITAVQHIELIDDDLTQTSEAAFILASMNNTSEVSSPFKDDSRRKQDFLNNTLEISPIKIQSPDREKKSPSPETSTDFVVIKLSTPVQSNGEPLEKPGSPEFFTEDKVSPDKRDASPPRTEVTVTNTSPSSSLSLKKNRPQGRPGGRAAQMLDLLSVNSDLKITMVGDRIEPEDAKKAGTTTPARRNLRILYNSVGDSSDNLPDNFGEDPENFLKLSRTLPTVTSSPSGPILKRKLIDIADEATTSPANKRKRVSFHDPPVSTTVAVQKYIEPLSMLRSPQSSVKKRLERQTRAGVKSPKRLENAFILDSVLSKTVESFTETNQTPTDDTQNISLDITPAVEIIKTSELNDTDPICPDLIDCNDSIDVIATELSSPTMQELFIKELEGKVETIGDLAKMTELEVNRLCIKAPKIQVAKKVLTDYIANRQAIGVETVVEEAFSEPMTESLLNESKMASVEMQTVEVEVSSTEMQTVVEPVMLASTQTDSVSTAHSSMQTDESPIKTTAEIIKSCIADKNDFVEKLSEQLSDASIKTIAEKLSSKSLFDILLKKNEDSTIPILNRLLKHQSKGVSKDRRNCTELSFLRNRLCERYDSRDLILLCSEILQVVHDKPA